MKKNYGAKLKNWYENSVDKAINIKTVPYRGIAPFKDLVIDILEKEGRVLYITGEDKDRVLLVEELKNNDYENISVHQTLEINEKQNVVVVDYFQALRVREEYDLIIYDDVNSFPLHQKPEMHQLISLLYPRAKKIIAYSFETVFMGMKTIEIPLAQRSGFVTEPRILETRLNLDEFVPTSVYEYLLWFVYEKKKVLFLTTNKKVKKKVARFLSKIDEAFESCIYDVDEIGTMKMEELSKDLTSAHIFISDDLDDYISVESNLEIVIHGADNPRYSYRELIFLCLRSGYFDDLNGEVLMLSQTITRDMEKARDMCRHFNKVIWDEGFE